MTDAAKQKFLVLYLTPASVMADWTKTDPAIRQAEQQKMQAAWGKWMGEHAKMFISTEAGGKTKRVTASGVSDTRNDIILFRLSKLNLTKRRRKPLKITRICKFRNHRLRSCTSGQWAECDGPRAAVSGSGAGRIFGA